MWPTNRLQQSEAWHGGWSRNEAFILSRVPVPVSARQRAVASADVAERGHLDIGSALGLGLGVRVCPLSLLTFCSTEPPPVPTSQQSVVTFGPTVVTALNAVPLTSMVWGR